MEKPLQNVDKIIFVYYNHNRYILHLMNFRIGTTDDELNERKKIIRRRKNEDNIYAKKRRC